LRSQNIRKFKGKHENQNTNQKSSGAEKKQAGINEL